MGQFCLAVDELFRSTAYRERFGWIDNITPVASAIEIGRLESRVLELIADRRYDLLQLAPPEVVDWDELESFQYHTESRSRVYRPDITLAEYLTTVEHAGLPLNELTADFFRHRRITGVNSERERRYEWSVWQCLSGEFELSDHTYVLDNGRFYVVDPDFLTALDDEIAPFTAANDLLPTAGLKQKERAYNLAATSGSERFLFMDEDLIRLPGTSAIEVCDILSNTKQLIHVKKYGGSQPLSHLFAQAANSADLLLRSRAFREAIRLRFIERNVDEVYHFISAEEFNPGEFEIVLAIIKRWGNDEIRSLPFFAKISLRRTINDLRARGYQVSVLRVPAV